MRQRAAFVIVEVRVMIGNSLHFADDVRPAFFCKELFDPRPVVRVSGKRSGLTISGHRSGKHKTSET